MTRAILFDCFGVLYIDVSEAYFSRFPEYYDDLHDLNKQSDHGFIDRPAYFAAVARITGVTMTETARAFAKEQVANNPLIEYIQHTLKPHYKIGLLSNIGRGWIQDFFDEHQLHQLFDSVVLSSEEGVAKPEPVIYQRAAERLGVLPEECLFIDDRQINCDGAVKAGMKALLFSDLSTLKQQLKQLV